MLEGCRIVHTLKLLEVNLRLVTLGWGCLNENDKSRMRCRDWRRQDEVRKNSKESMCAQFCPQLLSAALSLPFVHSLLQREGRGAERDSMQQMAELCSAEVRNSPLAWPKITACLLFSAQPSVHLTTMGLCLAWSSLCNQTVAADKKKKLVVAVDLL